MFFVKKFLAPLLFPLSVISILLLVGVVLLLLSRKLKAAKIFIVLGFFLFVACSNHWFADQVLGTLERQYSPILASDTLGKPLPDSLKSIKWVIVLGAGYDNDLRLPPTSRPSPSALARLAEGIRIYRKIPGSRLLLSGGAVFGSASEASGMAYLAELLGVPKTDIRLETKSLDTDDEAELIKPMVGDDRFVLVTSASHMPRSMMLFRHLGMSPIPAPTDFMVLDLPGPRPIKLYPSWQSIGKTERAVYEYLGTAWAKIRGKI